MSEARLGEEPAWADVTARWGEEEVHETYLAGLWDLEGFAEAGRRYKAVLDERPDDPVARRWRDEVVRRAAAMALAQIPRTRPPRQLPAGARRAILAAALVVAAAAVGWVLLGWPVARAP